MLTGSVMNFAVEIIFQPGILNACITVQHLESTHATTMLGWRGIRLTARSGQTLQPLCAQTLQAADTDKQGAVQRSCPEP